MPETANPAERHPVFLRKRAKQLSVAKPNQTRSRAAPAGEQRRYASPSMMLRRQRILEKAQDILFEGGSDALTIARLSAESDVAPRTIYRFFGDKEGVVLASIVHRMKEARAILAQQDKSYTIELIFRELEWGISEVDRLQKYTKAMISVYFSRSLHAEAVHELSSLARNRLLGWTRTMIEDGILLNKISVEKLAQDLADMEFLALHRWAFRGISLKQCLLEQKAGYLKSAIVLLQPDDAKPYIDLLASIYDALSWLDNDASAAKLEGLRA